jgi:hypothetical protein
MSRLPRHTRADRQAIYAGLIAFIVGFVAALLVLGQLIVRFVAPESRWWDILHSSINAILISFLAGLLSCAAVVWVFTRVQCRLNRSPEPVAGPNDEERDDV